MAVRSRILNPLWFAVPDFIWMLLALRLTLFLRYGENLTPEILDLHYRIFSIVFLLWVLVLFVHNLFDEWSLKRYHILFINFFSAAFFSLLTAAVYFYLQPDLLLTPRRVLLLLVVISFGLIMLWHLLIKYLLSNRITESYYLFSPNKELSSLHQEILKHNYLGLHVLGHVEDVNLLPVETLRSYSLIVEDQILADPQTTRKIYEIRERGVPVYSQFDFTEKLLRRIPLSYLREEWFFSYIEIKEGGLQSLVRRVIDIVVGLIFFAVFLLTFPFIALLIKIDSSGPVFFLQERVGRNRKPFRVYKYRTMKTENSGKGWTVQDDPRITRVGRILRRLHLDELPQSLNLLKGDMSVVGPRPEQVEIVTELSRQIPYYNERHLVKPGLTGWGQLNIYAGTLEESRLKLEYDLFYLKHRSLLFDLEIILKTLYHVIVGKKN